MILEVLRRIDKGYMLIEKAKIKAQKAMEVPSINRLDKKLRDMSEKEDLLREKVDSVRSDLLEKEKMLSEIESQLLAIIHIMYDSDQKNAKILQGLRDKEIDLKVVKSDLETQIMEKFYLIDLYTGDLNTYKAKLNKMESILNKRKIIQHGKVVYLEDKIKLMEKKIRKLRRVADPELLTLYDKKRQNVDIVFAAVENGICSACQMSLPNSIIEKIGINDAIIECDCCTRILYLEDNDKNDEDL